MNKAEEKNLGQAFGEKIQEIYKVCSSKQVSYNDIADALHQQSRFENVLSAFEDVQKITHCSTGCGGCHQKVLDVISEIMIDK